MLAFCEAAICLKFSKEKEGSLDMSPTNPVNVIFVTLPYRIKDYFLKQPTAWLAIFLGSDVLGAKTAVIRLSSAPLLPTQINLGSHLEDHPIILHNITIVGMIIVKFNTMSITRINIFIIQRVNFSS